MSLQGSLETFALPDVLVLLASTKKDGELRVSGAKIDGKIWVEKGQIVHSDINGKERASVDAVFELLRLDDGSFVFEADEAAPARHDPETIDAVLADAQVRLGEWREIAKVVPNLDVLVDMAEKAPGESVTISASQWRMLKSVAGGSSVAALMAAQELTEFDACKAVKELFEADLISLDLTANPKPAAAPAAPAAPAASGAADKGDKAGEKPADKPAAAEAKAGDAASGIQKRPTDMPRPEVKVEAKPAASENTPDPKRVEEVKSEVEKELAALVDQAAMNPSPAPVKPKVRATTNTPGSIDTEASRNGNGAGGAPKPEEKQALVAQLAALEGENEEKIAKKVEEHLARGGELPEVGEGDEPINRGLLLKFLSSVRN